MFNAKNKLEATEQLVLILEHARERPHMYFRRIDDPELVIGYLHGLRTGVNIWGLYWSSDCRNLAINARGIEPKASFNEDDLAAQGLTPAEIVLELLSIEIEMWQLHRKSLAESPIT